MPVILPPDAYGAWLDGASSPDALGALLCPYPDDRRLDAHAVAPRVNAARHDDAACLEPAASGMLL